MSYSLAQFIHHAQGGDPIQLTNNTPNTAVVFKIGKRTIEMAQKVVSRSLNNDGQYIEVVTDTRTIDLGVYSSARDALNCESLREMITAGTISAAAGSVPLSMVALASWSSSSSSFSSCSSCSCSSCSCSCSSSSCSCSCSCSSSCSCSCSSSCSSSNSSSCSCSCSSSSSSCSSGAAAIADLYWAADAADYDFENAANWALTNGGSGGAGVPDVTTVCHFTNSSAPNAPTLYSSNVKVKGISMTGGTHSVFTGGYSIEVGVSGISMYMGSFYIQSTSVLTLKGGFMGHIDLGASAGIVMANGSTAVTMMITGSNFKGNFTLDASSTGAVTFYDYIAGGYNTIQIKTLTLNPDNNLKLDIFAGGDFQFDTLSCNGTAGHLITIQNSPTGLAKMKKTGDAAVVTYTSFTNVDASASANPIDALLTNGNVDGTGNTNITFV